MRERVLGLLAGTLLVVGSVLGQPEAADATESHMKAAFLLKFASYVEWPPSAFPAPDAPFVIGVMDSDRVAGKLVGLIRGRSIDGHPVVARHVDADDPLKGLHLLLVGGADVQRLAPFIRAAEKTGVIVVTDSPHGLAAGSVINFVASGEGVGFEVSLEAAQRSDRKISSRMLAVARRVVPKGG